MQLGYMKNVTAEPERTVRQLLTVFGALFFYTYFD